MRVENTLNLASSVVSVGLVAFMLLACSDGTSAVMGPTQIVTAAPKGAPLRVYHNPYASVDWSSDVALKTQFHDHVGSSPSGLHAYDSAGYDVLSLMTYSGVASMSYAWHERHWPPEQWVAPIVLQSLKHVRFFIPNGEEVGYSHVLSPLMTSYIAKYEPAFDPVMQPWDYGGPSVEWNQGTQEEISLIKSLGGYPIVAHPVEGWDRYKDLVGFRGMEVYSGYVSFKKYEGVDAFYSIDRNPDMEANWDRVLARDDRVIGIAVNDHFGPDNTSVPARIRDSGKTLVLAHESTPAGFVDALQRGAVLAVRDLGDIKGGYPAIANISVTGTSITIGTASDVVWITNGMLVGAGQTVKFADIPRSATYIRAVVTRDANAVYTQAFSLRLIGDTNGDGLVDRADSETCTNVDIGIDRDPDHYAACLAARVGAN